MFKLMIFDDEYYFRQSLKTIVDYHDYGFEFIGEAGNGESAYFLILENKPDLVLVDINMPIMNGLELIEKCHLNNVNCQFILITGYAEFEYAQKALKYKVANYLLKPIDTDEFIRCLVHVRDSLLLEKNKAELFEKSISDKEKIKKEYELNKFISGQYHDNVIPEYISSTFHHYMVAIIDSACKIDKRKIENMDLNDVQITAFHNLNQQLCLIINYDQSIQSDDMIKMLLDKIQRDTDEELRIYTGQEYADAKKIMLSYNEALLASKSKTTLNDTIISYGQLNQEYTKELFSDQTKNKIVDAMLKLDRSLAKERITEVFQHCKLQNVDYRTFVIVAINMIDLIFSVAFKYKMTNYWSVHHDLVHLIINNKEVDLIENEIVSVTLQIIRDIPENEISDLVAETIDYIKDNYKNPALNIKLLSKELHINYNYLCSRFKIELGMTINSYINDIRMSKAKQYFDEGMQSVTLVANHVGYHDIAHFSKSFKKKFGVSPANYNKLNHTDLDKK